MSWGRCAAVAFASVVLIGCGQATTSVVRVSPALSPAPTQQSPQPSPATGVGSVTCTGGPGTSMSVISGVLLYDVTDPVQPRLVCRANNTFIQLIPGNAIAYTKSASSGETAIVRHDLITGGESQVGLLPADPRGSKSWTADGALQVYAGTAKQIDELSWSVPIQLWSKGAEHLLYSVKAGVGGIESRWSVVPIVEFSPNRSYLAISDSMYSVQSTQLRIFSVADFHGSLVANGARGGTWVADDRFVWATAEGVLMQWTPTGGAASSRSENWFGPTHSPDAMWLAGTLLSNYADPHVLIATVAGDTVIKTGLGSGPGFVSPTVVWYVGEKLCDMSTDQCGADPTVPDGTVHAYDVTAKTDRIVRFGIGESPMAAGLIFLCCTTRV